MPKSGETLQICDLKRVATHLVVSIFFGKKQLKNSENRIKTWLVTNSSTAHPVTQVWKNYLCNKALDKCFNSKKYLHMGLAVHVRRCLHSGFHRSNMCIYLMIHIYIFINKYRYIYLRHALKSICPLLSKVYLRIFYNAHALAFSTYIRTRVYKDT